MGGSDAGAAYFFERDPESGQWEQVAKRFGWDAQAGDNFGFSVSVSGTTALVGAPYKGPLEVFAGAVYFFERDPESGLWEQVAKRVGRYALAADLFGFSVSVSGATAVVGAPHEDTGGSDAGAAYVFERNAESGLWDQVARLTASDAQAFDQFGSSVSVSGTTAVVGARYEDTGGSAAGAAYVFERNATSGAWEEVARLTASDAQELYFFGSSVPVSGTTALVGAYGEDTGGANAGAAYVFERNATSGAWEEVARLTASDAQEGDLFGVSVSLSGTTALVGAHGEDTGGANAGAAYVFEW